MLDFSVYTEMDYVHQKLFGKIIIIIMRYGSVDSRPY